MKFMNRKARIIVIDDDEGIRTVFKANLEKIGYIVDVVDNGKDAIKKMEKQFYNLALIDIRLPNMEGIEILESIDKIQPNMVKLIITGYPSLDNAIEAVNKNADGYILKPVNMEELLIRIQKLLEKQRDDIKYSEEKVSEFISTRVKELETHQKFYEPL